MKRLYTLFVILIAFSCWLNVTDAQQPTPVSGNPSVLIYTGSVFWITHSEAITEAQTTKRLLQARGIDIEITQNENVVKQWMLSTASDGIVNVLILYGDVPSTIYPDGNAQPDGSVAENWIETSDGNMILNHADWIFWGGENAANGEQGLQNLMDIPDIRLGEYDIPMRVTASGKASTPSLKAFESDRPFPLNELQGDWFAEAVFASDTGDERATQADPVIVRDGNRGRIAIVHQTEFEKNPKGEVAAEIIINYLLAGAGPKIEGPWLWMIASTGQKGGRAAAISGRDYLAAASNGAVTEKRIAKNGVKGGALVGNRVWTPGELAPTGGDNITEIVNAIGLGEGDIDYHVAYGSLALNSPRKQNTTMYVGSDDAVKVWLNGKLVHDHPVDRGARDYQDGFPVTLKKGKNVLLVAVYEWEEHWSGFFGFEKGTAYSLIPPVFLPNKGVIPDRSLAARIRSRLGLGPNANLTKQKMRKLTQLTANDAGIKDLTGLEHATQLRSLSLVGNQIRDVSPLAGLKNLQVLSISENQLEGTGPLFTLLKKTPNLELDITIPMKEHPPMYWLTGSFTTNPTYIQGLTSVSADVETLWESTSPISPNIGHTRRFAVDTVAGKLYWIEQIDESRSELKRINLDGSNPQKLATLRSVLTSIAVDTKKRKLYWTNSGGRIQRANLNGKQIKTLVEHLEAPVNLTVDVNGGQLYWVEGLRIWRSNLNGKNIKRVVTAASDTGEVLVVSGIAVADGKIYWIQAEQDATKYPNSFFPEKVGGRILRADLNGSNVEELIVSENLLGSDLAVDPAGESLYYTAGFNPLGISHIFQKGLNGTSEDEIAVYYEDFGGPSQIVLGISPVSVAAAPTDSSQTSAQIETPDTTRLLANYPNPFNPETWIPYQLAAPAAVQITIYDTRGVLVRRLELGHQAAGTYTSRSRAAYWDGRNGQGERVASGIYFYQFQAGNVSSLRKMLILK